MQTSYKLDRTQSKISKQEPTKINCFNCDKFGQMANVCRSRPNEQYKTQTQEHTIMLVRLITIYYSKQNNWSCYLSTSRRNRWCTKS